MQFFCNSENWPDMNHVNGSYFVQKFMNVVKKKFSKILLVSLLFCCLEYLVVFIAECHNSGMEVLR